MSFLLRLIAGTRFRIEADNATDRSNFRFLYIEIAFAAVLGGIVTFHAAFLVRLGGTKELVALLTSVPALVSAVFSIPSARFLQGRADKRSWIFRSLLITRVGTGFIALLPLIFPGQAQYWLVAVVILLSLPTILFTNGFQALLGEIIPERSRAMVFSRRQIIWALGIVFVSAASGVWLDSVPFPANYQLMYAFGFIVSLGSQYYLSRLAIPESHRLPTRMHRAIQKADLPRPQLNRNIRKMLFNTGIYHFGLTLPTALFAPYYIDILNASDAWIGINSAAGFGGMVLGNILWARVLRRQSYNTVLRIASLLTWVFPIGIALFPSLFMITLFNFIVNLAHPGVELGTLNVMMKLGAGEQSAVYLSWYNTILNGALFISPLIGAFVADASSIPLVMFFSGVLRITGGLLFNFNRVEEPSRETGSVR